MGLKDLFKRFSKKEVPTVELDEFEKIINEIQLLMNNREDISTNNLLRYVKAAYQKEEGHEYTPSQIKLREYIEKEDVYKRLIGNRYISAYHELIETAHEKGMLNEYNQFIDSNYIVFANQIGKKEPISALTPVNVFICNNELCYQMLKGHFVDFCVGLQQTAKSRGEEISFSNLFPEIKNGYGNSFGFATICKNHPEFKNELIESAGRLIKMQEFQNEDGLLFICNMLTQIGSLDLQKEELKNLLSQNAKGIISTTKKPLQSLRTIISLNDKIECNLDIEELKTIVDNSPRRIAVEMSNRAIEDDKEHYNRVLSDKDIETMTIILEALAKETNSRLSELEKKNTGGFSDVYTLGSKVLKFGVCPEKFIIPKNHPRILQPLIRRNDLLEKNKYVEISELCDMSQTISDEELYNIYKELREAGLVWTDVKEKNVGRLLKPNKVYLDNAFGITDENGKVKFANETKLAGKGAGIEESPEDLNQKTLEKGEYVIIDLDWIYDENDKNIQVPQSSLYTSFEKRYQKELEKQKGIDIKEMDEI